MQRDSLDKIVGSYFAAFAAEPFTYKDVRYIPKPLRVSPQVVSGYTCPPNCGACCMKFSLDYLPAEPRPYELVPRDVELNGQPHVIYTDWQSDNANWHCRNLGAEARCDIHGHHPFSCDFELLRLKIFSDASSPNQLTQALYGRGHAMRKQDGTRGAMCEILKIPDITKKFVATGGTVEEWKQNCVRRLRRLAEWMSYFELSPRRVEEVIAAIQGGANFPIVIEVPPSPSPLGEVQRVPLLTHAPLADAGQEGATLEQLAEKIKHHSAAVRDAILHAIEVGKAAGEAKNKVGHRNFLPWLRHNCPGVGERMVQYCMKLARLVEPRPEEIAAVAEMTVLGAIQYLEQLALPVPKSAIIADLPEAEPETRTPTPGVPSLGLTGTRESPEDKALEFWNALWHLGDAIESGNSPPIEGWREHAEATHIAAVLSYLQAMR